MRLEKSVEFYKTLGDATRLKILTLLSIEPLNGLMIAEKLGLTTATISHHLTKMRNLHVVTEKREKNTIYFYVNHHVIKEHGEALLKFSTREERNEGMNTEKTKQKVMNNFFTPDNRLKIIPAQRKKKLIILQYLAEGLEMGRKYKESEINEYLLGFYEDFATLRREWIINQFFYRENNIYEMNPKEMWPKTSEG